MNRSASLLALVPVALWLTGCSGSSAPSEETTVLIQSFGPLTTRIVGTVAAPVTSSAANGANVTGIAGALVSQLILNFKGPSTLSETKIAFFSGRDGNYEIYSMNANGTGQTRLTNNAADDAAPSWSPDGTKIAFTSDRDGNGNSEIYVMNANGTNQTRLTNNAARDESPSWSSDSSRIVFSSERDGNSEIYAMNADGTNQIRLTNNVAGDYAPSWSPDGTKIAFESNRDGNAEIYSMNSNGTNPARLTNNVTPDYYPSWSPDGTKIAFTSLRDGNRGIYTMPSYGGYETNLSKPVSFTDYAPSWSGYFPRTPKTLVGAGGALGIAAAGFLYSQKGATLSSVVTFDTSTVVSRAGARVVNQTATETQGSDLLFSLTTTEGLASVKYVNLNEIGIPGAAIAPPIPAGSTGALVNFVAADGSVSSVIPYAANRATSLKPTHNGDLATYSGHFTAIFDDEGKNLAPSGAKSVTLNEKTGKLVGFE